MNEEQMKAFIRQEIRQNQNQARFQIQNIPYHLHNGTDSPYTYQPVVTYVGIVNHTGVAILQPKGWTIQQDGAAYLYKITHNLNTNLYVPTATASADSGSGFDSASISGQTKNSFDVFIFDTKNQVGSTCDFYFTVTLINNRSVTPPTYSGSLTQ